MRISMNPPAKSAQRLPAHRLSNPPCGGTLYAEDVTDLQMHQQRLRDPDGYRPSCCSRCGHGKLHVHDYRRRQQHNEEQGPLTVVRYLCPRCKASFQVLPRFVARHLWHNWPVVEAHTLPQLDPESAPPAVVPARTQRRWRARLLMSALLVVQVLVTSGSQVLERLAQQVGLHATRAELVRDYQRFRRIPPSQSLSSLAALLHRLCPTVRLI